MSAAMILGPSFALVALLLAVYLRLGSARFAAIERGETRIADIALGEKNWPAAAIQAANCLDNQFQLPVLFHALAGFELVTGKADFLFVVIGWAFVVTRIAHALIHVGSNNVRQRFRSWAAGFALLMAMWSIFAVKVIAGY